MQTSAELLMFQKLLALIALRYSLISAYPMKNLTSWIVCGMMETLCFAGTYATL